MVLATFTYDAQDRRIGRTEGGTTTATLYDGNSPILDFNSSGTQVARYLQGLGAVVNQVLAREKSGTVAWYLPDRLGTIRDIVDNTGAIIDHVDYSAYGKVLSESAPSVGDRLTGFAGLERDTATGLNLAVFRVQDPGTGRWLSEDPLGFAAGDADLYRYVGNDPGGLADPLGLMSDPPEADLLDGYGGGGRSGNLPRVNPNGGEQPTDTAWGKARDGIQQLEADLARETAIAAGGFCAAKALGAVGGAMRR